jgi:cell division protein ZapA (FtsZ GTPase activity inhibitor)
MTANATDEAFAEAVEALGMAAGYINKATKEIKARPPATDAERKRLNAAINEACAELQKFSTKLDDKSRALSVVS